MGKMVWFDLMRPMAALCVLRSEWANEQWSKAGRASHSLSAIQIKIIFIWAAERRNERSEPGWWRLVWFCFLCGGLWACRPWRSAKRKTNQNKQTNQQFIMNGAILWNESKEGNEINLLMEWTSAAQWKSNCGMEPKGGNKEWNDLLTGSGMPSRNELIWICENQWMKAAMGGATTKEQLNKKQIK